MTTLDKISKKKQELYDANNTQYKTYVQLLSAVSKANVNKFPISAPAFIAFPVDAIQQIVISPRVGVNVYTNTTPMNLARAILQFMYDSVPRLSKDSYLESPLELVDDNITDVNALAKSFIEMVDRGIGIDTSD